MPLEKKALYYSIRGGSENRNGRQELEEEIHFGSIQYLFSGFLSACYAEITWHYGALEQRHAEANGNA